MVGKFESNKDLVQELTSSGARHVGNIASLITGVVAEVAREIGEFVTDAIEMNEAAAAARRDAEQQREAERDYREAVDLDADDDVEVTTAVFTETPIAEPAEPAPGEKA
ncbi:hypothetical protein NCAST_34_01420 [Nocardia asteroides NBRC 15531]|uniref:Uncharacterized protein n=1 Tax=Nocardia asteroides NBRC 15531 TaxID=1110697 RepID=U5EPJ2_NOCAS|nr:hypothetical protein NCAST_34_01420 [Nocardia asteroides NBRC 15531]SFM74691.1 hypothetical protein SAMN05444423_10487 [Nocardia asteroides]VEG33855.1 Uncharacterised protein [Nocardia asteroides]